MDLLFTTPVAGKSMASPRRNIFRGHAMPVKPSFQYKGFYYIGSKPENIEKLVRIYGTGSVVEEIGDAKEELFMALDLEKGVLPEVIFCEAVFASESIHFFGQFLRRHRELSAVPFILDCDSLSRAEMESYRQQVRPDEMIEISSCEEQKLSSKVRFFRKMKDIHKDTVEIGRREICEPRENLGMGLLLKRVFDIFVASLLVLVLSPLFLLIALAIKLESRGPIFYISKRAGRGYKIFNFYKFRTMCQDADRKIRELHHLNQYGVSTGPTFFKVSNDPRVTRIGTFLRNTSLDELPQLINVLIGDMSLVGNRPLPLYEAATLTTDKYAARFMAPAGITGLWQVKKRGARDMSVEERIAMDIRYASDFGFATDFWIIANTPTALFQKENV